MISENIYSEILPQKKELPSESILIVDKNLLKISKIKKWLQQFPHVYTVQAGEELKQLKSFEKHLIKILELSQQIKSKNLTLVAVGGGSVGDFSGFLASVFKRGIPLIHIPSTWLAAIDSAHGGKTALNISGIKNQIGTFYPAHKIILCKPLLFTQPPERVEEAMGEVIKTALLAGGPLWNKLQNETSLNAKKLWLILPSMITYKNKIVARDPFEKKGLRYVLNFGHTFGHGFEALYHMPHGVAVNLGLRMAIDFSYLRGYISYNDYSSITNSPFLKSALSSRSDLQKYLSKPKQLIKIIANDKKISTDGNIKFVYLKKPGSPLVVETTLNELTNFSKLYRQKNFSQEII